MAPKRNTRFWGASWAPPAALLSKLGSTEISSEDGVLYLAGILNSVLFQHTVCAFPQNFWETILNIVTLKIYFFYIRKTPEIQQVG